MTTTITCLQCGGSLGPADRFCAQCGAELLWCASCGEFLLQAEQSCPKCGTPGIPRPESYTIPYELTEADSPWAEVVSRLKRATLGEFEIGHELGRGGMAAVFLAHELSLHRDVAIKVMSPGLLMGDGMIERFRREAITIAHLNHPNIVSVYSVRAAEGLHFFVMRCVPGRSLEQVIKEAGKLSIPMVRSILYQVGSALAYAHRFRVVHRDIKPANILVDEEGNAVVTDFGIAKAAEGPTHTHTGFMVGTPAYMSPEQCSGGEVSGASDQYSLGAVAYEMVTGLPPFSGSTYSVIQAHVERPPRPIREHSADCPPDLEEAILRMLAKDPNDRWPGMTQALSALGAAPLMEDDPLRSELSRLATAGRNNGFLGLPTPISQPPRTNAVLHVTPPGMMRAITILPPPPAVEVGDSFLLVARVHEDNASHLPSRPVEWSSDNPGVLRVNATKAVATAIAPGSALITATCDGNQGRLRVTVAPPRADAITVKGPEKPVSVGDEVRLEAIPRDKRGRVVPRPVTWRSEDDSVATISLDGVLVARSGGSTRISAELDEARAKVTVTIMPAPVAAVHISPPHELVTAGDSFALTATPLDRWAGTLSDRAVSWSTSDVRVAVVTAGGWVMTRNPGLVMLSATCEGVSASVSFNVVSREAAQPAPAAVHPHLSSGPWNLDEPVEVPQPARSRPRWIVAAGGAALVIGTLWLVGGRRMMTPSSPSETAVADADSGSREVSGAPEKDTAVPAAVNDSSAPGSVIIPQRPGRSRTPDSSARPVAEAQGRRGRVARNQPPSGSVAAALSIPPPEPLQVGDTVTLVAAALDPRGRPLKAAHVSWSSSQPQVADVDAATGRVRAYTPGTALIIARSGTESAIAPVSVLPAAVAAVRVEGARPLKVGDTLTLRAELQDQHDKRLSDRPIAWESSDDEVAGVDPASGAIDARAPGSVNITATSEGKSGQVSLTVLPEPRTGRPEPASDTAAPPAEAPSTNDVAAERELVMDRMKTGVEQCYGALQQKDVARLAELYKSATKSDQEKLKRLSRILRTNEWAAQVGERVDGTQRFDSATAAMDFSFQLTWKDAFGGRLSSKPVFRVEFAKNGDSWDLSSCRIVGSPKL